MNRILAYRLVANHVAYIKIKKKYVFPFQKRIELENRPGGGQSIKITSGNSARECQACNSHQEQKRDIPNDAQKDESDDGSDDESDDGSDDKPEMTSISIETKDSTSSDKSLGCCGVILACIAAIIAGIIAIGAVILIVAAVLIDIIIGIGSIVLGTKYLDDCPAEIMIPKGLIIFGVMLLVGRLLNSCHDYRGVRRGGNAEVSPCVVLLILAEFGMFIALCYYTFSINPITDPEEFDSKNYCHYGLYKTCYIGCIIGLIYYGLPICCLCCCVPLCVCAAFAAENEKNDRK